MLWLYLIAPGRAHSNSSSVLGVMLHSYAHWQAVYDTVGCDDLQG